MTTDDPTRDKAPAEILIGDHLAVDGEAADVSATRERTAAVMRATAEALERSEAQLHRSAEESPDKQTAARLHRFGDDVTAQARDIARHADQVCEDAVRRTRPDSRR